jgi:hypothetical protein
VEDGDARAQAQAQGEIIQMQVIQQPMFAWEVRESMDSLLLRGPDGLSVGPFRMGN